MIQGKAKSDLDRAMESYIEDEVERRMKDLALHLSVDGERVDIDNWYVSGGEVYAEIQGPLAFPETGMIGFVNQVNADEMAKMPA